jgi:hypothetical protein
MRLLASKEQALSIKWPKVQYQIAEKEQEIKPLLSLYHVLASSCGHLGKIKYSLLLAHTRLVRSEWSEVGRGFFIVQRLKYKFKKLFKNLALDTRIVRYIVACGVGQGWMLRLREFD